jgi:cysteinyl-tRNA synthetase
MAAPMNHKYHQPANFNIFLLSLVTVLVTNSFMHSELHALSTEEVPLVLTEQIAKLEAEIDTRVAILYGLDAEDQRWAAKAAKNFAEADRIRQALADEGIVLKDSPTGTTWEAATA